MRSGKLKCVESTGARYRLIFENNCKKTEPTADIYMYRGSPLILRNFIRQQNDKGEDQSNKGTR